MFPRADRWKVVAITLCLLCGSFAKKPLPEAACDKSTPLCLIAKASLFSDGVYGTLINQSATATFEDMSISFTLQYHGAIIDTAEAFLSASLRPGEKWQFKATTYHGAYLVTRATVDTWSNGRRYHEDFARFVPICVAPLIEHGCHW